MQRSKNENEILAMFSRSDVLWANTKAGQDPSVIVTYLDLIKNRNTLSPDAISKDGESTVEANTNDFELYRAFRDCLEPRSRAIPKAAIWRADLIRYSGQSMHSREPCRSIGHWNPPEQVEIFEVLQGHIIMLILCPTGEIEALTCLPGNSWIIPRGAFHLTYAMCSSLVINIYNSEDGKRDDNKYQRNTIPNALLKSANKEVSIVTFNGAKSVWRTIDQFPNVSCTSISDSLRHLHALDDNGFSNVIPEFH